MTAPARKHQPALNENAERREKVVKRKIAPRTKAEHVRKFSVSIPGPLVDWLKEKARDSSLSTVLTEIVREARDNDDRHRALGALLAEFRDPNDPITPQEQAEIDEELGISPEYRAQLDRLKTGRHR